MPRREDELTCAEFAHRIAVSTGYISDQINKPTKPKGCLKECLRYDEQDMKFYLYWPYALYEWMSAGKKIAARESQLEKYPPAKKPPEPKKPVEVPKSEPKPIEGLTEAAKSSGMFDDEDDDDDDDDNHRKEWVEEPFELGKIPDKIFTLEAIRRKEAAAAGIAELNYMEKMGTLVKKAMVYSTLFEFGQEMSAKAQQIPERMAPFIRSYIPDEMAALELINILRKEIEDFQIRMAEGPKENKEEDEQ